MIGIKVSRRYAKSILTLSQERGSLEKTFSDMSLLLDVCRHSREFRLMLKNPLINADKKLSIAKSIFAGKTDKLTMDFIAIIVRKHREFYLEEIAAEFISEYKVFKGITTALVITASGIDDRLRGEIARIVKDVSKNEVQLEEKVEPSIIGGFILRFSDLQYDTSIARSLSLLRQNFSKNHYKPKLPKL